MADQLEPETLLREISDLEGRIGELRQAANMPEPDLRATLDAALVELELALTALRTMGADRNAVAGPSAAADAERRVLRTVFQDAPVPLFLLDRDASVRRVNRQAAALLGTSPGYVSGKQFIAFCDLPTRAALRSHLAEVVRTGRRKKVDVRFLGRERPVEAAVTMARVWIRGEADPMVIAAAGPTGKSKNKPETAPAKPGTKAGTKAGAKPGSQAETATPATARGGASRRTDPATAPETRDDEAMAAIVHRMDVLATASELLLDDPVFNETVAMRRCARLLASEMADWVFIDIVESASAAGGGNGRGTELRRMVVMGTGNTDDTGAVARSLEEIEPGPDTLPHTVHTSRQSALRPHVENIDVLGVCADGQPACGKIGATSVLCVPIDDGTTSIGAITLASSGEQGPFDLLDLGVVQRLGRYLALVIRAARIFRRRAEVAESLQSSLLPRHLPSIPGLELAGSYLAATHGVEVGGDFYDVFPTKDDGWGLVLGDVGGKGEEAAAVTATARHGFRLLSRWQPGPAEVLAMVNDVLLDEDRFVTAVTAHLKVAGDRVSVTLGSAGHPPAIVIRADGVIRATPAGGVPLGLFEDFEAGLNDVDLAPGDTLVLYSDGILEACDIARRQFGQEKLMESLAAHATAPVPEMLRAVEDTLRGFCDDDLRDDVSMLAVRVLPPSSG